MTCNLKFAQHIDPENGFRRRVSADSPADLIIFIRSNRMLLRNPMICNTLVPCVRLLEYRSLPEREMQFSKRRAIPRSSMAKNDKSVVKMNSAVRNVPFRRLVRNYGTRE